MIHQGTKRKCQKCRLQELDVGALRPEKWARHPVNKRVPEGRDMSLWSADLMGMLRWGDQLEGLVISPRRDGETQKENYILPG